jgi:aspartyl protease family protein
VTLAAAVLLAVPANAAGSVKAIALFNERAMLSVDGSKAKIVRVGSTHLGVTVISSNTSEAVVEFNGQRQTLTLNGTMILSKSLAVSPPKSYFATVQMEVDNLGFFRGNGAINGRDLEFLVDTGANLVVLSSRDADEIGLEYRQGTRTNASTAAGNAPMYLIRLQTVSLGGIELENVSAGVIVGRFPEIALLGMTFLSQLNMQREGDNMILSRR